MLDFDGTLAPFVRERMQARPYAGVCERLESLCANPRIRLVLISGRGAVELASLLPSGLKLEIWGSHGRERLDPGGIGYAALPLRAAQQQCLEQLEAAVRERGYAHAIEKKVGSIALHTRGLTQWDAHQITAIAREFSCSIPADPEDSGLEWLPFDGGVELRGSGCTKATAVHSILRDELSGTPVAYLGDDLTDEDAFAAIHASRSRNPGLAVLVRPESRPSAADLWLRPPDELLAFLDRWLAAAGAPGDRP